MGDRCFLSLICETKNQEKICVAFSGLRTGYSEIESPYHGRNDLVWLGFEEVNYGGESERDNLVTHGLEFIGTHSDGDEYCGLTFISVDGKQHGLRQSHGEPVARLDERTLLVCRDDLKEINEYRRARALICAKWSLDVGTCLPLPAPPLSPEMRRAYLEGGNDLEGRP